MKLLTLFFCLISNSSFACVIDGFLDAGYLNSAETFVVIDINVQQEEVTIVNSGKKIKFLNHARCVSTKKIENGRYLLVNKSPFSRFEERGAIALYQGYFLSLEKDLAMFSQIFEQKNFNNKKIIPINERYYRVCNEGHICKKVTACGKSQIFNGIFTRFVEREFLNLNKCTLELSVQDFGKCVNNFCG